MKLHHVSFIVDDVNLSLAFYQDILGLETENHRPDLGYPGAWLKLEEGKQIHLLQLPNPDQDSIRPEHGGRDRHAAFIIESLDVIKSRLDQANHQYTLSKSGRKALFCRDPDGNALEFIQLP